jgi:hypothetical protein
MTPPTLGRFFNQTQKQIPQNLENSDLYSIYAKKCSLPHPTAVACLSQYIC